MKPAILDRPDIIFRLVGGTDENNLHVERALDSGQQPVLVSTWELSDEERDLLASGSRIQLVVWGLTHPPVALRVEEPMVDQVAESEAVRGDLCPNCGDAALGVPEIVSDFLDWAADPNRRVRRCSSCGTETPA